MSARKPRTKKVTEQEAPAPKSPEICWSGETQATLATAWKITDDVGGVSLDVGYISREDWAKACQSSFYGAYPRSETRIYFPIAVFNELALFLADYVEKVGLKPQEQKP